MLGAVDLSNFVLARMRDQFSDVLDETAEVVPPCRPERRWTDFPAPVK
jgi:hypothetical protein